MDEVMSTVLRFQGEGLVWWVEDAMEDMRTSGLADVVNSTLDTAVEPYNTELSWRNPVEDDDRRESERSKATWILTRLRTPTN